MALDLEKISKGITKTGFHLEFKIGTVLRKNGWHLISNRCYVDDQEGAVREIDLLAYKVSNIKDFTLYTVLIISCKKSESNAWALLARPVVQDDPNYNWRPFKGWSNHQAISYYLTGKTWPNAYHNKVSDACPSIFEPPAVDVFAFQEVNKTSGSVQNDKPIFSSITSLMKAQSYEMSLLESRHKDKKRVYQFNLISVIDSDLIQILFTEDGISSKSVTSEDYLCRYILNKEEAIARIKFTTADFFPKLILDYTNLHNQNKQVFSEYYDKFYSDAYKTWRKSSLITEDLHKELRNSLLHARYSFDKKYERPTNLDTFWNEKKERLEIGISYNDVSEEMLKSFNSNEELKQATIEALANVFHYDGDFIFDEGIPF
ncbi:MULTISPECIES: hypothetical protein [unclassified Pseudomonas]|uniref:hypothetical protein n=1 Tax=unclassified Pseudomonas TaxID=196821 RepID=UPI000B6A8600|nr:MULTISPECIES: hypothetical protein [unclassified Pseudomonas]SNT00447.1 hypothetical protein SAMN05660216_02191 [Pseudomonas sp. LAMO17WK12:I8]SNY21865.1 hypothetical protein SAMN05660700_02194 [Pseudomonas sp. LAMO17WK12:I7]SNY23751.1 hypothetical protein SAMN05660344_02516 [Pseudomonas sp. LAMO17WK12:I11]SNY26566.1 hypothetical protein SAMN05660893_02889 [Pseudomonas sp. LAMO17WK12:I12]